MTREATSNLARNGEDLMEDGDYAGGHYTLIVTSYELLSLDLATRKIEYIDDHV